MSSGHRAVHLEGSKSSARRLKRYSSGSSNSKGSAGGSSSSSHRNKKNRCHLNSSRDEFKKARPPTFNGEVNTSQEAESWLLWDDKIFPSPRLLGKYEGKGIHIQPEWKSIYMVGAP